MKNTSAGITEHDVHLLQAELEELYSVHIRIYNRMVGGTAKKPQVAYYALAYNSLGKPLPSHYRQQLMWNRRDYQDFAGIAYKLLWLLSGALDTWSHEQTREMQQAGPTELPPIEAYLARSF